MNGLLYIVVGNHDTDNRINAYRQLINVFDIQYGYRMNYKHLSLWFSHYPMIMKNFEDPKPTWNISGHTHAQQPFVNGQYNICCIGLDAWNNKPVLLDDAISSIKQYTRETYNL